MTPYIYVFIRKDLTPEQMIVQSCHACLELPKAPKETHLILLGIRNESELVKTSQMLDSKGIKHQMFFEPDYSTGFTAIATEPCYGARRRTFSKYRLLRFNG